MIHYNLMQAKYMTFTPDYNYKVTIVVLCVNINLANQLN